RVAEANRQYYAQSASLYEASETCVTDRRFQSRLEADLDQIIAISGQHPKVTQALDACGGSGNVSLKLLYRGVDVTLVDISSELLEILRGKFASPRMTAGSVCSEIVSFFSDTN